MNRRTVTSCKERKFVWTRSAFWRLLIWLKRWQKTWNKDTLYAFKRVYLPKCFRFSLKLRRCQKHRCKELRWLNCPQRLYFQKFDFFTDVMQVLYYCCDCNLVYIILGHRICGNTFVSRRARLNYWNWLFFEAKSDFNWNCRARILVEFQIGSPQFGNIWGYIFGRWSWSIENFCSLQSSLWFLELSGVLIINLLIGKTFPFEGGES